ncbi:hypothetical protein BDN67DRAFT_1072350 [Paxillus ammoniavirescens]|nr:hypothetical protein BDN67DRAFT_1072350 [Paxillus ammoniavirescens]
MPSSECPQDVYARRMIRTDPSRGYPLWHPEPDSNLPEACLTEGLRIGDVGIVTADGSFDLLFNICSPRDHPLHQLCGVPETFKQVHLPVYEFRDFPFTDSPGRAISTQSINQRNITAEVSGGDSTVARASVGLNLEFSSSSAEGAILVLPEGAGKRDFAHLTILREEAQKNGESWHHFAHINRGRTAGDDLYLITGHHKASSWSVAAFSDAGGSTGLSATFSAGQVVRGNIAMAYSWQVTNPVHWRVGPEQGHNTHKRNQATSIRGFRIALKQRPFAFFSKRVDVSVQHTGTKSSGSGVSPAPASLSGSGTQGSVESHQSLHGASDRGRMKMLPHQLPNDSGANENTDLYNISVQPSPSPSKAYHPSDAINRFLLDSEPRANIAVTHDSQWMHVFHQDFPPIGDSEDDLIERIRCCFQVEYDSIGGGSVYLRERGWEGSQSAKDNDKGKSITEQDVSEGADTASQSTREHAPGNAPVTRSPQAAAASKYSHRLVVIVAAQLLGFMSTFGFSWLVEEILQQFIILDSFLTQMIFAQPRISTTVITLISLAPMSLFCLSVKEATKVFMRRPGTLPETSAGVALVMGPLVFRREYLKLIIVTCFVFWVLNLLVIGCATLLAPTLVSRCYDLDGTELSITSPAFSNLLAIELGAHRPTISHHDSFPIIDVGESMSGISAAGVSFGRPGIINFNQAKYNVSTGGLLPAIKSFAGSQTPPGPNKTRTQFSGGTTLVNSTIHGAGSNWRAIQTKYSVHQQGITADINCQRADANSQVLNFTGFNTTLTVTSLGSTSPAYTLVTWNSTAKCNTNSIATQQYVTLGNTSEQLDIAGAGLLSTIICPGHKDPSDVYNRFVIATQGFYKYNFLPSTICEVTPLITTTRAHYTNGGIINASQIISTQTFSADNADLLFYLAGVVDYHARNSQGLMNNIVGDTLYSIHSREFNTPISHNTNAVYRELEDYWRGVIEFSATFLRAGYSAQGAFQDGIPSNMTSPLNGTMLVLTAGRGLTYTAPILFLGISREEHRDDGKGTPLSLKKNVVIGGRGRPLTYLTSQRGLTARLSNFDKGLVRGYRGQTRGDQTRPEDVGSMKKGPPGGLGGGW